MKHVARGAFLVAAVVLTLGGYRDALANGCKPDGGTCRTNQSCCSEGTCQPGNVESACGSGDDCEVCDAANQSGTVCVPSGTGSGYHCGCTSQGDCPAGRACLLAGIALCTTSCNQPNETPCNGGCCSGDPFSGGGTCQPGTEDTACGNTGATCVDCTSSGATCMSGTCAP